MRTPLMLLVLAGLMSGCETAAGVGDLPDLPNWAVADLTEAQEAMRRCDVRMANGHYDATWRAHPRNPEAALGFAVTDSTLFAEDPEIETALIHFGFTGGLDSEAILWGPGALLESMRRHTRRYGYYDHIEVHLPYPAVGNYERNFHTELDPDARAMDVMERYWALEDRLRRIQRAYETAAEGAPITLEVNGICEVGAVEFDAVGLWSMAAAIEAHLFLMRLSQAYDWDFHLADALDYRDDSPERLRQQATILNTHLGHLVHPGVVDDVRDRLRRYFELMDRTLEAAERAGAPGPNGVVDWRAFRPGLLGHMRRQVDAARAMTEGGTTAPGFTPQIQGDLRDLLEGEIDLAVFGRTFVVQEDPEWGEAWIEVDEAPIDAMLVAHALDRSPFDIDRGEVEWEHIDDWRGTNTEWQVVEVDSERFTRPLRVRRFYEPVVARFIDHFYLTR